MLGFLFGRQWRTRSLRKRWDRIREKSLKKKDPVRSTILAKLDQVENNLRVLEESRNISRFEQARLSKEIEIDLEGLHAMLGDKSEPVKYSQQTQQSQQGQRKI